LKPHPYVPNSIWTTPRLNRTAAWKRQSLREQRQYYRQHMEEMQKMSSFFDAIAQPVEEEPSRKMPVFVN
jgi:hypothetical protein